MKNLLYTTILAALIIGACKPKDKNNEEEPKASASITITPRYSSTHNSNWPTKYYEGDTLRYTFKIESGTDVSKIELKFGGSTFRTFTSFANARSIEIKDSLILGASNSSLEVLVTESNDLTTSKSESYTISTLTEYSRFRLYNKESQYVDSLTVYYWFPASANTTYNGETLQNDYPLVVTTKSVSLILSTRSTIFNPANSSKQLIKRIGTESAVTGTHTNKFVKSNVSYNQLTTPNEIIANYQANIGTESVLQNGRMYIENFNEGDVFIVANDLLPNGNIDTYFVFEIVDIIDDGLTSADSGGSDDDYFVVKVKFFSRNRF